MLLIRSFEKTCAGIAALLTFACTGCAIDANAHADHAAIESEGASSQAEALTFPRFDIPIHRIPNIPILPRVPFRQLFDSRTGILLSFPFGELPSTGVSSVETMTLPYYAGGGVIGTKVHTTAGTLTWSDGSELDNVDFVYRPNGQAPYGQSLEITGPGAPLLAMPALFNNNGPGLVQGTVTYYLSLGLNRACAAAPALVAIQEQDDSGAWKDVAVEPMSRHSGTPNPWSRTTTQVSAKIDTSGSPAVRLQVRAGSDLCGDRVNVMFESATLFGQVCIPDMANPGMCL